MKKKIIFIAAALTSLMAFYSYEAGSTRRKVNTGAPQKRDSVISVSLSFAGDLMCHSPQFQYAFIEKDSFDFRPFFRYIKPGLSEADITFGNFETVTSGREELYSGYPMFNSPAAYLSALKDAGFDFLFTSNNHSMDRGEKGVLRTLKELSKNNLGYCGTYLSKKDRDSLRIISLKGFRIAVLSYTYGVNDNFIPPGKKFLVSLIDKERIRIDLLKARTENPDVILVYFHFGEEYSTEPNEYQKEISQFAAENGADLIIGSHPHVIQPVKLLKGKHKLKNTLVAYSLGNFFSNQSGRYRDSGVILNIRLCKNLQTDSLYISGLSFTPTWVFKGFTGKKKEFLILPAEMSFNGAEYPFITQPVRIKMNQSFDDTRMVIQKEDSIFTERIIYN